MADKAPSHKLMESISIADVPAPSLMNIHSVALGPGGKIFLSDEFNHRIICVDQSGKYLFDIGEMGAGPGQFWYPRGMAVVENSGGHELLVCDSWNHRIQRFNMEGGFKSAYGSVGDGAHSFNEPVAIVPSADGAVWILDRCNNRIKKHEMDGAYIASFGSLLSADSELMANNPIDAYTGEPEKYMHGFNYPAGLAVMSGGGLAVADTCNRRVCLVGSDGSLIKTITFDDNGSSRKYPSYVCEFKDNMLLVGFIDGSVRLVDIFRPWVEKAIMEASDDSAALAIAVEREGDGHGVIMTADCRRGVVERMEIDQPAFEECSQEPSPLDAAEEVCVTPGWSSRDCEYWRTYLKNLSNTPETGEITRVYVSKCISNALLVSQNVTKFEEIMMKESVHIQELRQLYNAAGSAARLQELKQRHSMHYLEYLRARKQHRIQIRSLTQNLGGACEFLAAPGASSQMSGEFGRLDETLRAAYAQRKAEYLEVAGWIHQHFSASESVNVIAVTHAFTVLSFLVDHIKLIRATLGKLGMEYAAEEPLDNFQLLSTILWRQRNDRRSIGYDIYPIIYYVSAHWGFENVAESALGKCDDGDKSYIVNCAIMLHDRLSLGDADRGALLRAIRPAVGIASDPQGIYHVVTRLQGLAEYDAADKLITKHVQEYQGDPEKADILEIPIRRQELLKGTRGVSVSLSTGQAVSGALPGDAKAAMVAGHDLRYLFSLSINNPDTGKPVKPLLARIVSESAVLLSSTDGDIYLYDTETGCRLVLKGDSEALDLLVVSADEAIVVRRSADPANGFGRIEKLAISSGALSGLVEKKEDLPCAPGKIALAGNDGYVICGFAHDDPALPIVCLVDKGFNEWKPHALPKLGRIGDFATFEDEVCIPFWASNAVYLINMSDKSGGLMDKKYNVTPGGVAYGPLGQLAITDVRGIGLKVFGRDREFLYSITSLVEHGVTYMINSSAIHSSVGTRFQSGDILVADSENDKVHVLAWA